MTERAVLYGSIAFSVIALTVLAIVTVIAWGSEQAAPVLAHVFEIIGILVPILVLVARATETKRAVEDTKRITQHNRGVTELTASKVAAIQQQIQDAETPHLCHDPLCHKNGGGK